MRNKWGYPNFHQHKSCACAYITLDKLYKNVKQVLFLTIDFYYKETLGINVNMNTWNVPVKKRNVIMEYLHKLAHRKNQGKFRHLAT